MFSINKSIIGKDKSINTWTDKDGKERSMMAWAQHKNKFQNFKGEMREVNGKIGKAPMTRDLAIEYIAKKGYATGFVLKDDQLEKGRTMGSNTKEANIFMVDFDNTWSLEEAMQHPWWNKVWFAYGTPSYGAIQQELTDQDLLKLPKIQADAIQKMVGQPKRNFRLVFKFSETVTAARIENVGRGFLSLFPLADASCKDLARIMFGAVNARVEMPQEYELTKDEILILESKGKEWADTNAKTYIHTVNGTASKSAADGTTIKLHDGTVYTIDELLNMQPGWKQACYSPFREETNPSAFVSILQNGAVFSFDSGSNEKHIWSKPETATLLKLTRRIVEPDIIEEHEITKPDTEREFHGLMPSTQRRQIISNFLKQNHQNALIRTAEGFGKSTMIVEHLLSAGKKVIFACASNAQALEKAESFAARFDTQRVISKSALFKEILNLDPIMNDKKSAWENPGFNEDANVELLLEEGKATTKEEALEIIQHLAQEASNSRILFAKLAVTTFSMANVLYAMNNGNTGYTIVIDDPNTSNLYRAIYEFDEDDKTQIPKIVEQREVKDVMFCQEYMCHDPIIWTTTEKLVMDIVKLIQPQTAVLDVQESLENDNLIMIVDSHIVRKELKPIIPVINTCIEHDLSTKIHLIANGAGAEHNMVSSKGRNDLTGDSCIIASIPHPIEVFNTIAALALTPEDALMISKTEVRNQMVVDIVNQAIGREQGYRSSGNHTLVICDPNLLVTLKYNCRYNLRGIDGMKRRGKLHGVPVEWAVHIPDWWTLYMSFIKTWNQYVKIIKNRVYSTLSLHRLTLDDKQMKILKAHLDKPVHDAHMIWKKVTEVIEGDSWDDRRNYSETLHVLVKDAHDGFKMDDGRKKQKSQTFKSKLAKTNASKLGKKKFIGPDGKAKMFIPGTQPRGWLPK